jgi:hypothetical protein
LRTNAAVADRGPRAQDHAQGLGRDRVAARAPARGAVAALVAVVAAAVAPSRGHTRNPNLSPNPNLLSAVAHVPSPSQEIVQSPNLSQRASPGLAPGLRTTDLNLDLNQNRKPSHHQKKDPVRAASVPEVTDPDRHQAANTARAAAAHHPQ